MVDESKHLHEGRSVAGAQDGLSHIHRRKSCGLGCPHRTTRSVEAGTLVRGGQRASYQQSRNEGCVPCIASLVSPDKWLLCDDSFRQHNSGFVSKKTGGTHSPSLCMEVWEILTWCQTRKILLKTRHIPGKFNVIADNLSRPNRTLQTEWSICPTVLGQIFSTWGKPMSDLFATRFNNKLPMFVSPVPDHRAWAVDAFSLEWKRLFAYVFLPFRMIPQVLNKIRNVDCTIILIAPVWPQRSWFNNLLELVTASPIQLPCKEDLLSQAQGTVFHPNIEMLRLHAWRLSGNQFETESFLSTQPLASRMLNGNLQTKSISLNGRNSVIGVVKGRLIQSIPLYTL